MKRFVEEVFVTEGVPQFTFVTPPNFNEILLDVRRLGKPVVIEGQSGTKEPMGSDSIDCYRSITSEGVRMRLAPCAHASTSEKPDAGILHVRACVGCVG
jgi:hypothetical protein